MRKVLGLAVGAAMMAAGPVQAAEWWVINVTNDDDILFLDAESLTSTGDVKNAWIQIVRKKPSDNIKSMTVLYRIDCTSRTEAKISLFMYDNNRKLTYSNHYDYPKASPIAPDTVMEGVRKITCSHPSTWEEYFGAFPVSASPRDVADGIHAELAGKK